MNNYHSNTKWQKFQIMKLLKLVNKQEDGVLISSMWSPVATIKSIAYSPVQYWSHWTSLFYYLPPTWMTYHARHTVLHFLNDDDFN